jgi:hypothetical protein
MKMFSAYSHAMHAIKKVEEETKPNHWDCSVVFKNNSNYNMKLKSILVLDEKKKNNLLELQPESGDNLEVVPPSKTFTSDSWFIESETEPKFFRKIDYSITSKVEKNTRINLTLAENVFDLIYLSMEKAFSKTELKSFEEDTIEAVLTIKNNGTAKVQGLLIKDVIPADFIPIVSADEIQVRNSSGSLQSSQISIYLNPDDQNHEKEHAIEFEINNTENAIADLIDVDQFLELRYKIKAVVPDYTKDYTFPCEIESCYPFYPGYIAPLCYVKQYSIPRANLPKVQVIHQRRNILIGKEIFAGRDIDEFGISLFIKNNSNIEVNDIEVKDTIADFFELVSSNVDYKIQKVKKTSNQLLSFKIDNILPFQEKEVRYYIRNVSENKINFDQLESFILG